MALRLPDFVMDRHSTRWFAVTCGSLGACAACVLLGVGFIAGRMGSDADPARGMDALRSLAASDSASDRVPPELLRATATHGTSTLAVCTARMDEEADGFFALDYLTGDLKGWVYSPRWGSFGGLFVTNVSQFFGPPGKNAEYLLVSGHIQPPAADKTTRSAAMVLYVVDVQGGQFVALSVPWDRTAKNAGVQQANVIVPLGGDAIRPALAPGAGARRPPAKPADANPPANNANPPKNNANNQNNQNNN